LENAAYIGLSRQLTLRRELDIAANNIANAETTAFKVEQLLTATQEGRGATNVGVRGPANFVLDNGVGRDFSAGALRETGNTLDVAIEGDGAFFSVQGANGVRYTRSGAFTADPTGQLTTPHGEPVLDDGGAPIVMDPAKGPVSISADGVISQQGERIARLGVVRFDSLGVLQKEGDGLYRNTSNVEPSAAPDARVRQGMLEGSNVNSLVEITNLMEITRAYERVTRMIEQTNDLSRRSVERLGRAA
jgi:flagellar basal-body rod protein FlgF